MDKDKKKKKTTKKASGKYGPMGTIIKKAIQATTKKKKTKKK